MIWKSYLLTFSLAGAALSGAQRDSFGNIQSGASIFEDFECSCGQVHRQLLSNPLVQTAKGEGVDGGNAIQVTYVGNERGSDHVGKIFPLPKKGFEFTLNYDVKFDRDFQFVKGGKLHGLLPDRAVSGGRPVGPRNWSARVMWRADGKLGTYTYHQQQRGRFGDRGVPVDPFVPAKGTYYAVSLHVRLNQPASASNGFSRLYVNGKLIERDENLKFRSLDGPRTLISKALFSTFHGGHDQSWAPRARNGAYARVHAYFDNFAIYPGKRIRPRPGS